MKCFIMCILAGCTLRLEKDPEDKKNAFLSERKDQFLALCVYQLMKTVRRGWGEFMCDSGTSLLCVHDYLYRGSISERSREKYNT
jgi:hypothetical protein